MIRKLNKSVIALTIITVMIASTIIYALAIRYTASDYGYFSCYGYTYRHKAEAWCSDSDHWFYGATEITCTSASTLPSGYAAAKARLYDSNGYLISATDYDYNTSPYIGLAQVTDHYYSTTGTFYGRGVVKAYNGNGYCTPIDTNMSPYISNL